MVGGCAHDEELKKKQNAQEHEIEILKARIKRLERSNSDLESKLNLAVSNLSAEPATELSSEESSGTVMKSQASLQTAKEDAEEQVNTGGIGLNSIDISVSEGFESSLDDSAYPYPEMEREPQSEPQRRISSTLPTGAQNPETNDAVTLVIDGETLQMPSTNDPKKIYGWGMDRLKEGRRQGAIDAFNRILVQFPKHHLADNAMYWSGVAEEEQGKYDSAIQMWLQLPKRFPKSPKNPDALYKLGLAYERTGNLARANAALSEMIRKYPKAEKRAEAEAALRRVRERM